MLLDTCALLWLASGSPELSSHARESIAKAPAVHVSAISAFEIGLKWMQQRLTLPMPAKEWFAAVVRHHDLTVVPLDEAICMESTMLPAIHKDPADRFIIATARLYHWPIVTKDKVFSSYDVPTLG